MTPAPAAQPSESVKWIVYILECSDHSLYTGITTDLRRRMEEHQSGIGAKYTKRRGPFIVRYTEQPLTRSAALKREAAIKSLDRSAKLALIRGYCFVHSSATRLPLTGRGPRRARPQAGPSKSR